MNGMVAETAEALFAAIAAEAETPVLSGLQAQGDVVIMPLEMARTFSSGVLAPVPAEGLVVVPAGRGGHEHRLFAAEPGGVLFGWQMKDRPRGNVSVFLAKSAAYLLHHGGPASAVTEGDHEMLGIAPGWYAIRQQREMLPGIVRTGWTRVAD